MDAPKSENGGMSAWTHEDRRRITAEAMAKGDKELLERCWFSDNFEPSLGMAGGLASLIIVTREEKREERKRVAAIKAERDAIKERWKAEDAS